MSDTPDYEAVVRVPVSDPNQVVGAVLRPPRAVTLGRRRSDRWMARAAALLFFLLIAHLLYTSWQQTEVLRQLERIESPPTVVVVTTTTT